MQKYILLSFIFFVFISCSTHPVQENLKGLKVADNKHFFADKNGNPFFWLGDTGWLLFSKLNREEAVFYLDDRKLKGFNVIQVMVLHSLSECNVYGDSALTGGNVARVKVTSGNSFGNPEEYDYWDHVDYIVEKAGEKGMYMALVPVWGSNVKSGAVSWEEAAVYAQWLAERYRVHPNIIWLNGGDIPGSDSIEVWKIIGSTLRKYDPDHLITFHPRGRMQSSDWFHKESWLDFNMFQSGHRRYDQDDTQRNYGEDNWKYAEADYRLEPIKPTLDGEPSYEGIPQGLHDTLQPKWKDSDIRRYAYWSVFTGGCGFTYGHSAVMQFFKSGDKGSYGNKIIWNEALKAPGAGQMIHIKNLMLSRSFFDRIPDQSLIDGPSGLKYDYQAATRGEDYAFVYTFNGKNIRVVLGKIAGEKISAGWYDPRTGAFEKTAEYPNQGVKEFDPPGEPVEGNDWILVLDSQK